jgi:hypothetical protein
VISIRLLHVMVVIVMPVMIVVVVDVAVGSRTEVSH